LQFDGRTHCAICRWSAAAAELCNSLCDAVCEQRSGGFRCRRFEIFRTMARTRQSPCDRPTRRLRRLRQSNWSGECSVESDRGKKYWEMNSDTVAPTSRGDPGERSQPLQTTILRSVSRSFYLSIRFLPSQVRDPIAL